MRILLSLTATDWFLLAFLMQALTILLYWKVSKPDPLSILRRRYAFVFSLVAAFAFTIGLVRWGQQLEAQNQAYNEAHRYDPANFGH